MRTTQRTKLIETLHSYGRVAVAFSGGIDSTVVAQAAYEALGDAAIAVTAVSESLAAGELEDAQELAQKIGIRHRVIRTEDSPTPIIGATTPIAATFARASYMAVCPESWVISGLK